MINHKRQRGVALLTVLLLVVTITVLASVMMVGQNLTTRKSSLLFDQNQLIQHLKAGEQLALQQLRIDMSENQFDSLQDNWATAIPPYTTDNGDTIELIISDSSAKFNINNLYNNGQADLHALESFERLLTSLELDTSFAQAVLDWQDPNDTVHGNDSIEQSSYELKEGQTIANQPFIDINQLTALPNITPQVVNTLRPYITAVPYYLPININTADEKVLVAILGESKRNNISEIINQRENKPVETQEELQALQLIEQNDKDTDTDPNKSNNQDPTADNEQGIRDDDDSNDQGDTNDQASANEDTKDKPPQASDNLLTIKSSAFDVFVQVTHNDKRNPKVRYATFKVAKGNIPSHTNQSNTDGENSDALQIFSVRQWSFKPLL